jgi:hypothetical protein
VNSVLMIRPDIEPRFDSGARLSPYTDVRSVWCVSHGLMVPGMEQQSHVHGVYMSRLSCWQEGKQGRGMDE